MSHGKCTKCAKTVYLQEGFKVGPPGKEMPFHKGCFKCSNPGCTWQLTLTNYKFCDGKAYCANHNPMTGFSNQTVKVSGNTSIEDKGMQMVTQGPKLDNMKSNVLVGDSKHSQVESLLTSHGKNAPRQGVQNNQTVRSVSSNVGGNTLDMSSQHALNAPRQGVQTNQNVRSVSSNVGGNTLDMSSQHALNAPRQGVQNNQNVRSVSGGNKTLDMSSQHALNAPRQGVQNNQTVRVENKSQNVEVVNKQESTVETPTTTTAPPTTTTSTPTTTTTTNSKKSEGKKEPEGKIECLGGKRWNVENYKGNQQIKLENVERGQVVYLYNLVDCVVEVTCDKFASISVDKVSRTGIKFNKSIGSLEVVNSNRVQIQGSAPSYTIDKSDGITLFLTHQDLEAQIISSKAEINIVLLNGEEEPKETPIPSQFITIFDSNSDSWQTKPTDHVGA